MNVNYLASNKLPVISLWNLGLGVTEFMATVTGIRDTYPHLDYRGDQGTVRRRKFAENDCYYCNRVKGKGDAADIGRYCSLL